MLNHNKRLIKSKSKILLLALCIFGLLFSYSCNCRNNSTAPVDNTEPKVYTPATTLSRTLMVVKSDGSDTSLPIGITVSDASYTWEVSGDLTTDTFEIVDGNLKVKQEKLADITADKKTATLTVNYQKLPTFKENDTLSKESDTFNIEVIKATAISLGNQVKGIFGSTSGDIRAFNVNGVTFLVDAVTVDGTKFTLDSVGADNNDKSDYETKQIGKEYFGSDALLGELKKSLTGSLKNYISDITYNKNLANGEAQVFYYTLTTKDTCEIDSKEFSVVINNDKHRTSGKLAIEWTEN